MASHNLVERKPGFRKTWNILVPLIYCFDIILGLVSIVVVLLQKRLLACLVPPLRCSFMIPDMISYFSNSFQTCIWIRLYLQLNAKGSIKFLVIYKKLQS